jgi:hypothetical protein
MELFCAKVEYLSASNTGGKRNRGVQECSVRILNYYCTKVQFFNVTDVYYFHCDLCKRVNFCDSLFLSHHAFLSFFLVSRIAALK